MLISAILTTPVSTAPRVHNTGPHLLSSEDFDTVSALGSLTSEGHVLRFYGYRPVKPHHWRSRRIHQGPEGSRCRALDVEGMRTGCSDPQKADTSPCMIRRKVQFAFFLVWAYAYTEVTLSSLDAFLDLRFRVSE